MIAIIDLGSNTVRLNIYSIENNHFNLILSNKETASLSAFVNEFNQLSEAGIQVALKIIRHYVSILKALNIQQAYMIITAAIRNVDNSQDIVSKIKQIVPFSVDLLSEEEEALADLEGVRIEHQFDNGLVLDIGGGSTEVVGLQGKEVVFAKALKIGSLNTYTKFVNKLLPTSKELERVEKAVLKQVKDFDLPKLHIEHVYGVGGTIRATRKLAIALLDLPIDTNVLTYDHVHSLYKMLLSHKKSIYMKIVQLIPERLHTIFTGLQILKTMIRYFDKPLLIINQRGVREGYLMRKLKMVPNVVVQPKQEQHEKTRKNKK
jgi:exopolyphosphatase/guanosine-5'-triphosphate,3'-diphosphate pyrophosphatase